MLFKTTITLLTMFFLSELNLAGGSDGLYRVLMVMVPFFLLRLKLFGSFGIPQLGFNIRLPATWSGLDLKSIVMVSPTGINPKTGGLNPSDDQR